MKVIEVIDWKVKGMSLVPIILCEDEKGMSSVTCKEIEPNVYDCVLHRKHYKLDKNLNVI